MYRMPAEWKSHEATWLAWPHNESHWPGKLEKIPPVYAQIIRALSQSEKVFVCVNDAQMEKEAREIIRQAQDDTGNVFFYHIPTNASWSRDHGPIFVRNENNKLVILDWGFNAWGGKFPPWDLDDVVPQRISEKFGFPIVSPGIILEGGSIDVNGKGTLLTTEQCLLNKNRNPHLGRKEIETYLEKYLGATNVLWLKEGIEGDDTDGHIDDIARFVDEGTVACCVEENKADPNYEILKKNFEDLERQYDQDAAPLRIVPMPMPDPVYYEDNRLPASYANFYIANAVVLVPTFRCSADEKALNILSELFPTRKIVGIDCTDLVWGYGTIHCSTQQQPSPQ